MTRPTPIGRLAGLAVALLALSACGGPTESTGAEATEYTLRFGNDHVLDLDTEVIYDCSSGGCPGREWDIYVFDRGDFRVVHQNEPWAKIAHLRGRAFPDVDRDDARSAQFTGTFIGEPFDDTRVILIQTATGAVFKLGNPVERAATGTVTFQAAVLDRIMALDRGR